MMTTILWTIGFGWVLAISVAIAAKNRRLQMVLLFFPVVVAGLTFTGGCGDDTVKPDASVGLTDAEKAELEAARKKAGDDDMNPDERKKAGERVAELEKKAGQEKLDASSTGGTPEGDIAAACTDPEAPSVLREECAAEAERKKKDQSSFGGEIQPRSPPSRNTDYRFKPDPIRIKVIRGVVKFCKQKHTDPKARELCGQ